MRITLKFSLTVEFFLRVTTGLLFLCSGCVSAPKYMPTCYESAQSRFGTIPLPAAKKFYLCPTIDSLPADCRSVLDTKFIPSSYTTDAIEQELKTSGLNPVRPDFTFGPGFDPLKQSISEKADKSEKAVYLGTELLWLSAGLWSLDAKLFSPAGDILFEKRGICSVNDIPQLDSQMVLHMTLRQILADPKFKQALE